ncbi:Alpha/Beta hydrolase protein [Amylocystis lapponica]|nr:Alpha/Beta hydrolase protein [Amylocystis lapponica]
MHWPSATVLAVLSSSFGALALPALRPTPLSPLTSGHKRDLTQLSASELSGFAPYTQFARAAYCPTDKITGWSCGDACNALPGFQPTLTGGDGNDVQLFFVGYWPDNNTVVVAHEGTDPTQFLSDLTDVDILTENLNGTMFPGVSSDVSVHSGFANEQAKTASSIMAEVKNLISQHGATSVLTIGHSLGGAIAELDALFLVMNLPSNIHVKSFTFGTPRVGNPAFATFFDSLVTDFTRLNNELDPIPTVPGRFLGFQHPAGEIHIVKDNEAVSCPGADDGTDSQCSDKAVPNVFVGNILNHLGPYQGISIGTLFCT